METRLCAGAVVRTDWPGLKEPLLRPRPSIRAAGPIWHLVRRPGTAGQSQSVGTGGATADRHSMATLIIQVGGATRAAGPTESIRNITTRLVPDEKANDFGVL